MSTALYVAFLAYLVGVIVFGYILVDPKMNPHKKDIPDWFWIIAALFWPMALIDYLFTGLK